MADRRCPNCGERVPSNCITCPKCYYRLPSPADTTRGSGSSGGEKKKSRWGSSDSSGDGSGKKQPKKKTALILAIIPGFFGILGLGQFYMRQWKKGAIFLIGGLLTYYLALILGFFIFTWMISIPFYIIFISLFASSVYQILLGERYDRMKEQQEQMFNRFQ